MIGIGVVVVVVVVVGGGFGLMHNTTPFCKRIEHGLTYFAFASLLFREEYYIGVEGSG